MQKACAAKLVTLIIVRKEKYAQEMSVGFPASQKQIVLVIFINTSAH